MNVLPNCVPEELSQSLLKELKSIDNSNVMDCLIIEKIKAHYDSLYSPKCKIKCFANDLRKEKFNIYCTLSCRPSSIITSELYEKRYNHLKCEPVDESCASYVCLRERDEERFWLMKHHMVMQNSSLNFPLVYSRKDPQKDITYLYFQRYKPLTPIIKKDKYETLQKLFILYELKYASMMIDAFCCDYLDNYTNFELVIRFKDANFILTNPSKIIILSSRCNLTRTIADDFEYLSLLSAEEREELLGASGSFHGMTIVEVIFRSFYRLIQVETLIFRNDDIFLSNCETKPEIGRLYGYNKSLGFVLNVSQTSCDMLLFTEPNNKGKYHTNLITVTDLSQLKPTRSQMMISQPYVTIP